MVWLWSKKELGMKIVHISDIHIKNFKYHEEYLEVFQELYEYIKQVKPDYVINTGDTAHTKTQISPEFVDLCSQHIRAISELAPYVIILGNHDLTLTNLNRQDAISPVVNNLGLSNVHLYTKSGIYSHKEVDFYVYSCNDTGQYPVVVNNEKLKIGLYHGPLVGATVDSGWALDAHDSVEMFNGLDVVLLGDIHKQQFLKPHIAYAGSLIQQNHGEARDKGFLLWDINNGNVVTTSIKLSGNRFETIEIESVDDLDVVYKQVQRDDTIKRLRIKSKNDLNLHEYKTIKERFKKNKSIEELQIIVDKTINETHAQIELEHFNVLDVNNQNILLQEYIKDKPQSIIDAVIELNTKLHDTSETGVSCTWELTRLEWDNLFCYGEQNSINFSNLNGVIGLIAPNSWGKSSVIDTIVFALYQAITKHNYKNHTLINSRHDEARALVEFKIDNNIFQVERSLKRTKTKGKESAKAVVNFSMNNNSLNSLNKNETDKEIAKYIGNYDNFLITSLISQLKEEDIIKSKDTDRRRILFRLFGLECFERKEEKAKEELKFYTRKIKEYQSRTSLLEMKEQIESYISFNETQLNELKNQQKILTECIDIQYQKSIDVSATKIKINDVKYSVEELSPKLTKLHKLIKQNTNDILQVESILNKLDNIDIDQLHKMQKKLENINRLMSDKNAVMAAIATKEHLLSKLYEDIKILDKVPCNGQYITCQFIKNSHKAKDDIYGIEEEIKVLRETAEQIKIEETPEVLSKQITQTLNSLKEKDVNKQKLTDLIKQREQNLALMELLNQHLLSIKAAELEIKYNAKIDAEVQSLNVDIEKNKKLLCDVNSNIEDVGKKLNVKNIELVVLSEQLKELEAALMGFEVYDAYVDSIGKHGLPMALLRKQLPTLCTVANKILQNVCDFTINVEFNENDDVIDIFIVKDTKQLIEIAGGAEKFIVSMALRVALLDLTNMPKPNFFIVDEGFGALDSQNLDNINKMFSYLRNRFKHILLVSHIDSMKDIIDDVIDISRNEINESKIEVI